MKEMKRGWKSQRVVHVNLHVWRRASSSLFILEKKLKTSTVSIKKTNKKEKEKTKES